jgi:hypothetical protein
VLSNTFRARKQFYAELSRIRLARSVRHGWLTNVFGQVLTGARGVYSALRVHAELTKGLGIKLSHSTGRFLCDVRIFRAAPEVANTTMSHHSPRQRIWLIDGSVGICLTSSGSPTSPRTQLEGQGLLLCRAPHLLEDGSGLGDRLQCQYWSRRQRFDDGYPTSSHHQRDS